MSLATPTLAARAALLLGLVIAVDVEKEICSSSLHLLQINSNVHVHGAPTTVDCDDVLAQATLPVQHRPLTLLQVAARTGEVTQYHPSNDEDPQDIPRAEHHERHRRILHEDDAPKAERSSKAQERSHDGITALLSKGAESAGDEEAHRSGKTLESGDGQRSDEDAEQAEAHKPAAKDLDRTSEAEDDEKPDAKVLQGARIAPFGKEDTARELQHHAAKTQDTLVDAIENAEVAEIKRSIFRSLTRLRAAEIKEFDTIARLETQAIDEYNDNHHYRSENPLDYIHGAEVKVAEDKYTSFHD